MNLLIWHAPIIECLLRVSDCKTHQTLRLTHRNFWVISKNAVLAQAKQSCTHRDCVHGNSWCICDCISMKQHRIQTAVRNWRCSVHAPCVEMYDKTERVKYLNRVCRQCFKTHWVKTGMRPDFLCLKK